MASELPALLNQIESVWETLTPLSRASVKFKRIEGQRPIGQTVRREAMRGFEMTEIGRRTIAEHAGGTQTEYRVAADVSYETKVFGTPKVLQRVIEEDEHQLVSAIRQQAVWTSATVLVEFGDDRSVTDLDRETAVLRLVLLCHVVETYGS